MNTRARNLSTSRKRPARQAEAARFPNNELEELSPEEVQSRLLDRMAQGAKLCRQVEALLRREPGPELETILALHRVLVLKLSAESQGAPELLALANTLMKPLMDWARLEESRKERELAEQKHRDQMAAQKAEKEKEQPGPCQALRPETLEKIERELRLL